VEEAKKKQRVNISIRYYPPPLVIPDDSVVKNTLKPEDISIDIVFERDTQYLAIPSSAFKVAMRDVSFDAYAGMYVYVCAWRVYGDDSHHFSNLYYSFLFLLV